MRKALQQAHDRAKARIDATLPVVSEEERRVFSRVPFSAWTEIQQQGNYWNAMLKDVSLSGFLVEEPKNWHLEEDEPILATIRFDNHGCITMKANIVHRKEGKVGFRSNAIDLDSITSLRKIIECSLGDNVVVAKELAALQPIEEIA